MYTHELFDTKQEWKGCHMRIKTIGLLLATTLLITGCSNQASGTLEITENGTYDVANYSQVVVNVENDEADEAILDETERNTNEQRSLDLVRAQFKGFSMDVPTVLAEDYTEAELTENDNVTLQHTQESGYGTEYLFVDQYTYEWRTSGPEIESFNDGPQEDVGGITMAIKHGHNGDTRSIDVAFVNGNTIYTVALSYPVALDDLYSDYAEEFYRTIQLD